MRCTNLRRNAFDARGELKMMWFSDPCQERVASSKNKGKVEPGPGFQARYTEKVSSSQISGAWRKDTAREELHYEKIKLFEKSGDMWINMAKIVKDEVSVAMKEGFEKKKRKKYIIVHNLPEPASTLTYAERWESDKEMIQKIASYFLGIDLNISQVFRLGHKSRNKPQLLNVMLWEEECRNQLLKGSKKFRNLKNVTTQWRAIYT